MRITFEPLSVKCIAPKRKNDRDAVKLYVAAATDIGQLDKLESESEPSISNPLTVGPYELAPNGQLNLSEMPPTGRANWRTRPLEFTETSAIRFNMTGVGLHKAEITGSSIEDLPPFQKAAMKALRDVFMGLTPAGKVMDKVADLAVKAAEAGHNNHCIGTLFIFEKHYTGADLAFNLLKSSGILRVAFEPSDGGNFPVSDGCQKPAYSASVRIQLQDKVSFKLTHQAKQVETGPRGVNQNMLEQCKPAEQVLVWLVKRENTYHLTPAIELSILKYVWSINGRMLREVDRQITLPLDVLHHETVVPFKSKRSNKNVTLSYSIDRRGSLRIDCPARAGNFSMDLRCEIHNARNESINVYSKKLNVESEIIDGNAAYKRYLKCVAEFWKGFQLRFEQLTDHVRTMPKVVPHFDPAGGWRQLEALSLGVEKLMNETRRFTERFRGR